MSEEKIDYREVPNEFIIKWNEDGWKEFYKNHQKLFLGIRAKYVKLYYKRGWIIKFEYLKRSKRLRATLNDTYCSDLENRFKNLEVTCEDLTDELLEEIKEKVNGKYNNGYKEYVTQQNLFIKNNSLTKPDWYCIDMEYEESKRGEASKCGEKRNRSEFRFDIIALKTEPEEGKPNIALIELKHGDTAIKDNNSGEKKKSGVNGHLNDFYKFYKCGNSNGSSKNVLQENIKRLIKSYKGLVNNPPNIDENNFEINPEFYIIFMGCKKNTKEKVYQCIKEGDFTELENGNGVYAKDDNGIFECKFLFSSEDGLDIEKLNINAILNSSQYKIL